MFSPVIETFMFTFLRFLFRCMDQKTCCVKIRNTEAFTTKKTTVQAFETTYMGPIFMLHYKYSFIMNICFVTFIFGPAMPLLFPMAFFAMFLYYT